jgi:hypothetical protein
MGCWYLYYSQTSFAKFPNEIHPIHKPYLLVPSHQAIHTRSEGQEQYSWEKHQLNNHATLDAPEECFSEINVKLAIEIRCRNYDDFAA